MQMLSLRKILLEAERIAMFEAKFPKGLGVLYPTTFFYDWHNILTGRL